MDDLLFTDDIETYYDDGEYCGDEIKQDVWQEFRNALNYNVHGNIVAFVKTGRWDGHRYAVSEAQDTNLLRCLQLCLEDVNSWYTDDIDFYSTHKHQDSEHYIIYRERRPDVTDPMISNLRRLSMSTGNFDREFVERCTTSLRTIVRKRVGLNDI